MHAAAKDDERPAELAKVNRGAENNSEAPLSGAYFALLEKHNAVKSRCEALALENQRILELPEESRELHAKVADIERSNASAKCTSTR